MEASIKWCYGTFCERCIWLTNNGCSCWNGLNKEVF